MSIFQIVAYIGLQYAGRRHWNEHIGLTHSPCCVGI